MRDNLCKICYSFIRDTVMDNYNFIHATVFNRIQARDMIYQSYFPSAFEIPLLHVSELEIHTVRAMILLVTSVGLLML